MQRNEAFQVLAEMAPHGIAVVQGRAVAWSNPALARILRATPFHLQGSRLEEWVHPEDAARVAGLIQSLEEGEPVPPPVVVRRSRPGGGRLEVAGGPASWQGGPAVVVMVSDALPEEGQEERSLRLKLQGAMALAGAASHELNQPLQAVSAQCEMLAYQAGGDLVRHRIGSILHQVQRMAQIVESLRRITRYRTKEYLDGEQILDLRRSQDPEK
jgi:signal transduction histidine kinase